MSDLHGEAHEDLPSNVIALRGVSPKARYGPPLTVLGFGAIGLALIFVNFRLGIFVFTGAVVLALILRAVLPTRRAGLLVVRTRTIDLTVLSILAGGLLLLTVLVPGSFPT